MHIIGHRGARGLAPENTVNSFHKALEYSADEVELDVRVCKDNTVICHHDPKLIDASNAISPIHLHTYSELQQHKPDLATLNEAFDAIHRRIPVILEIKPGEPTVPIISIIKQRLRNGWEPQEIRIASFSQSILREIHAALPELPIVINERWSGLRATYRARQVGARRITMNQRWLWSGFIHAMYRSGYQLSAYTVNDPSKARRWSRYGLFGILTDYPDRFQQK
jgi:glycerophosphoryl diester phosphodiesterase